MTKEQIKIQALLVDKDYLIKEVEKWKKAYEGLKLYSDTLCIKEQPKVNKQLKKLGL